MRSESGRQEACESASCVEMMKRCPGGLAEEGVGRACDWEPSEGALLRDAKVDSVITLDGTYKDSSAWLPRGMIGANLGRLGDPLVGDS